MNYPMVDRVRAEMHKAEMARDKCRDRLRRIDIDDPKQAATIFKYTRARSDHALVASKLASYLRQHEAHDFYGDLGETMAVQAFNGGSTAYGHGFRVPFEVRIKGELELVYMDLREATSTGIVSDALHGVGAEAQKQGDALGAIQQRIKARSVLHLAKQLERIIDEHAEGVGEFLISPDNAIDYDPGVVADQVRAGTRGLINDETRRSAAAATGLLASPAGHYRP